MHLRRHPPSTPSLRLPLTARIVFLVHKVTPPFSSSAFRLTWNEQDRAHVAAPRWYVSFALVGPWTVADISPKCLLLVHHCLELRIRRTSRIPRTNLAEPFGSPFPLVALDNPSHNTQLHLIFAFNIALTYSYAWLCVERVDSWRNGRSRCRPHRQPADNILRTILSCSLIHYFIIAEELPRVLRPTDSFLRLPVRPPLFLHLHSSRC